VSGHRDVVLPAGWVRSIVPSRLPVHRFDQGVIYAGPAHVEVTVGPDAVLSPEAARELARRLAEAADLADRLDRP